MISSKALTFCALSIAAAFISIADVAQVSAATPASLSTVAAAANTQAHALPRFIAFIAYIVGIALVAVGLLNAKKHAEDPKSSVLTFLGPLAIGGLMIALPATLDVIISSLDVWGAPGNDNLTSRDAAAETVGGAVRRFTLGVVRSPETLNLVSTICFAVSIGLMYSALRGAYQISQGANGDPRISGVVWRLIGAGLLASIKFTEHMLRASLFGDGASAAHNFAASSQMFTASAGGGLEANLIALVADIREPVIDATFAVLFVFGLILVAHTLYQMSGINFEQQRTSLGQLIGRLIMGSVMMSGWSVYQAVYLSIFGGTEVPDYMAATLAYDPAVFGADAARARADNLLRACLAWVQIIGVIAFARGWFGLKSSLDGGNSSKSAAITQVIAGTLCINMPATLRMIGETLDIPIIQF